MKVLLNLIVVFLILSCSTKKQKVDLLVVNANVYTVNDEQEKASAIVVDNGKFLAIGTTKDLEEKYESYKRIDAKGKTILPGLIDAHCHFVGMGLAEQQIRLEGTKSFDEVLEKLVAFQEEKQLSFITGRGWDQNDWEIKEFPSKEKLDSLFPKIPVAIRRVDGHALLANQAAIDLAGVTIQTPYSGGEILKKNGALTGVFIDSPMDLIMTKIPQPSIAERVEAIKVAEEICLKLGLTTVNDAGLDRRDIEIIDSLQQRGELKIKVYAMVSATKQNLDYYLNKGIYKTGRLNVSSFKYYGDGALGSRGAAMKEPYADKEHHHGALIYSVEHLKDIAVRIANSEFQMNTHAIGDSTNYIVLQTYKEVLEGKEDRRWKIEHAQIVDLEDFHYFKDIMPSIQPTHATSDMYWAEDRVGKERIKGGYAYKELLNQYGKVALGTDFPVEKVNPMLTFYAAVARKDSNGYPEMGFQMENALTREETLKGMTLWAAYSNFEENEKGSIEIGKDADFVILDKDIMKIEIEDVPEINIIDTYINGEKVN